jgi:hypothetical protein
VKYGGFGRPSWQVCWGGRKLRWRRFEAEWTEVAEEEIEPETQQWLDFWQALDQSRIWDWNEVYYRAADRVDQQKESSDDEQQEIEPDDVISWSVTILLRDGRLIDSSGSNAVPGATRRSRKGRGQRRAEKPERIPEPVATEETPEKSDEQKSDPSNVGIPDDTFDQFLTAVRKLIGGREFAVQDGDETPETLATQFRTLTPKRKTRPDPFAEDELATTIRKPRKRSRTGAKRSTSGRKRTTRVPEGGSEGKTGKRQRTRRPRGEKSEQGQKVGAENSSTAGRRRRRRRKPSGDSPAGESNAPQEKKTTPSSDKHGQASSGTAPARKKRRRRRRRSGRGKGADSGKSSASGGNNSP